MKIDFPDSNEEMQDIPHELVAQEYHFQTKMLKRAQKNQLDQNFLYLKLMGLFVLVSATNLIFNLARACKGETNTYQTPQELKMEYYYRIDKALLETIDKKKEAIDRLRPFSRLFEQKIEDWCRVELTYTSNLLDEESKDHLTKKEVEQVLRGHRVLNGSPFARKEAQNHISAWNWVTEIAKNISKITEINEEIICCINKLLFDGIVEYTSYAGIYRNQTVRIMGSRVILPRPEKVGLCMKTFIDDLYKLSDKHPIELATFAHLNLVSIHPFQDGNGRTARLLMNLILIMKGFSPCIIDIDKRLEYMESLQTAQLEKKAKNFYDFIFQRANQSIDWQLDMAKNLTTTIGLFK